MVLNCMALLLKCVRQFFLGVAGFGVELVAVLSCMVWFVVVSMGCWLFGFVGWLIWWCVGFVLCSLVGLWALASGCML